MSLELKLPPVALWLIIGGLMWLTAFFAAPLRFHFQTRIVVAVLLGLAGLIVAAAGVISFRRADTTVNPMQPNSASSLVVSGIYRFTRNPMYLGMLLVLIGWGVFLGSAFALIWIPGFIVYMNLFQILPEERALGRRFGDDFFAYKANVRRWI